MLRLAARRGRDGKTTWSYQPINMWARMLPQSLRPVLTMPKQLSILPPAEGVTAGVKP